LADRDPLEALIAELPVHAAPTGWKQRVLSAIDAGTPPAALRARSRVWSRWWLAGGAALAAAAGLTVIIAIDRETRPPAAPSIAMKVRPAHAGTRTRALPEVTNEVLCEEARFILANVMAEARYGRQNRYDDIRRVCQGATSIPFSEYIGFLEKSGYLRHDPANENLEVSPDGETVVNGGKLAEFTERAVSHFKKLRQRRAMAVASPEVGDTVVISVRGAPSLRVYRDGARIARCPGDARCDVTQAGVSFTLQLTGSGAISAVAYTTPLPDPSGWHASPSDLDLDLAFATGRQIATAATATLEVH
jgi:hypothetical protein